MDASLHLGDLVMVRNSEDEQWKYAYFAQFCDYSDKPQVIANGQSLFTRTTSDGLQILHFTEEDLEWHDGAEHLFQRETYNYWQRPTELAVFEQFPVVSGMSKEHLRRGDLVQIRYEENEPWRYAHFHRFGDDGRIQVLACGWTPYTELNSNGLQKHQDDSEFKYCININVSNYWRYPTEITHSGDLRDTEQYRSQWCLNEELEAY